MTHLLKSGCWTILGCHLLLGWPWSNDCVGHGHKWAIPSTFGFPVLHNFLDPHSIGLFQVFKKNPLVWIHLWRPSQELVTNGLLLFYRVLRLCLVIIFSILNFRVCDLDKGSQVLIFYASIVSLLLKHRIWLCYCEKHGIGDDVSCVRICSVLSDPFFLRVSVLFYESLGWRTAFDWHRRVFFYIFLFFFIFYFLSPACYWTFLHLECLRLLKLGSSSSIHRSLCVDHVLLILKISFLTSSTPMLGIVQLCSYGS